MDEKNPNLPQADAVTAPDINWTGALSDISQEIRPDEQAIAAAGLMDPADMELEKIIQETKAGVWDTDEDAPPVPTAEDAFKDDEFRSTFGEGEILDQVFSDQPITPAEPEPQPQEPPVLPKEDILTAPLEKGRPKRKEGYGLFGLPHIAATIILFLLVIVIGVSLANIGWLCAADVLALSRGPISATIIIEDGDSIDTIANKLKDAGLIDYPQLFTLFADITDAQEKIKPGEYQFNPADAEDSNIIYDYKALIDLMSPHRTGQVVVEDLRIPEGYTCAQIFQLLEENNVCTQAAMEEYIASIDPEDPNAPTLKEYWFLEGVQWGDKYSLEGYLFPNTYDFYENDSPQRVVEKMLDSFDANFSDFMKKKLHLLQEEQGYSVRDIIIIASMIEKETANDSESYTISSVIYNRLNNSSQYPYLNIDATLVYMLGGKTELTEADKQIDNPYNTYKYKGLPPGPISNPSQNSIGAALDPAVTVDEETEKRVYYYYYALDPSTGEHRFFRTYEEHLAFLATLGGS